MTRPRAVLTAGGTREAVDDVRYLSNVATGSLPAAMAEALLLRGFDVDYVHGPGARLPARLNLALPLLDADWQGAAERALADAQRRADALAAAGGRLRLHPVTSAADADATLHRVVRAGRPTLVACAMAVADYAPRRVRGKLSSRLPSEAEDGAPAMRLDLDATAKVIDGVKRAAPTCALLGFKLLSDQDEAGHVVASQKLAARSGADWVFSNDMRDYGAGRRCGTLRGPDGAALLRLDGGADGDALERLAVALVEAVVARLPAAAGGAG